MAFEQLVAEAAAKKEHKKKGKDKKPETPTHAQDTAADVPNVPHASHA